MPPRPPRRTYSEDSTAADGPDSTEEGETSHTNDYDYDDDEDPDDEELEAEADRRTNFMAKGGSYSIQKVLRGEARAKKGVTRFDRRRILQKREASGNNESIDDSTNNEMEDDESDRKGVDEQVLNALGDSYTSHSETTDRVEDEIVEDDEDAEEFEAEVARRSKFIAKGGSHSIKKVLNGEARTGTAGPARLDRRRIGGRGDNEDDVAPRSRVPPKTPLRSISVDSTDSQIENEADKRSSFMLKGASHSIRKLFEGNTKKEDRGLNRIERRKMHFKKESNAVHYAEKPHKKPEEINQARLKAEEEMKAKATERKAGRKAAMRMPRRPTKPKTPAKAEPEEDIIEDDDAELEAEADRRSLMFKGGSHSIRNLFAGNIKKSGGGLNRFNRRMMHFEKEAKAVHYTDKQHLKPDEINARHREEAARLRQEKDDDVDDNQTDVGDEESKEAVDAEIESLHGDVDDDDDEEDEQGDTEIEAEADRRSNFMAKGASYSIQKILKGEARAKKGVTRFDRRQMHFKKEAQAIHSRDKEKQQEKAEEPSENPSESEREIVFKNEEESTTNNEGDELFDEDNLDPEDREIVEEADRRSAFMAKGGSYSIQKVLRGEARATKGVSRFDRRRMHFKKEAKAIHSHDHDGEMAQSAPNDRSAKPPTRKASTCDNGNGDSDSDLDEEEKGLLAQVDNRHLMMLKGASHSIRNIFAGKTKYTEEPADNFNRRTSRLKKTSMTKADAKKKEAPPEPKPEPDPEIVDEEDDVDDEEDDPTDSVQDEEGIDFRQRFSLKGASHSIRNLLSGKARRNSSGIDDEIERLAGSTDDGADMDDKDREIEEEADRRSNFMAKGGSYSITKVLSGNARKKNSGITRFDRRKMHFKKESEAIHRRDHDVDGNEEKNPEKTEEDKDEVDEDAEIEEEADRRSNFILKGASYSIQKVLAGTARKSTTPVSRLDRRKMHFKKKESDSDKPSDEAPLPAQSKDSPDDKAPTAQASDHADNKGNQDDSDFDEEDAELLAQADDRTMMMLRGASHSIRNLFSGNTKMHQHDNEGTGFNRRLSRMKQSPRNSKTNAEMAANTEQAEGTQGSSGETIMNPVAPKEVERNEVNDDQEEEEEEEIDFRKRFSLKGASHSIKKVLAGTARTSKSSTPTQVSRLDRRKMAFRKPSNGSSGM